MRRAIDERSQLLMAALTEDDMHAPRLRFDARFAAYVILYSVAFLLDRGLNALLSSVAWSSTGSVIRLLVGAINPGPQRSRS